MYVTEEVHEIASEYGRNGYFCSVVSVLDFVEIRLNSIRQSISLQDFFFNYALICKENQCKRRYNKLYKNCTIEFYLLKDMSRKHHYLPQFYLKGFVGEGEKMYYCKKKYDTYRGISTAGIYYANDLNNVDFGQYGIYDLENKFFLEKDNQYAQAFIDMHNKYAYDIYAMPAQTKADIVEFVLGLYWRTPGGYDHVADLIENDGLLTGDLHLYNKKTNQYLRDEDIPDFVADTKSNTTNKKSFMPIFYEENVRKHDWSKLEEKFLIWETSKPLIIGDIPYIPLKSECKRGKILEEFVIPLDRNHLLIYAENKPAFLEENLYQLINLSIIDGASEKISCNDIDFLKQEMKFARNRIQRLALLGFSPVSRYLNVIMQFQCRFKTYKEFETWYTAQNYGDRQYFFTEKGM